MLKKIKKKVCATADSYPFKSNLQQKNVVLRATVTTKNKIREYIRSTGDQFKMRCYAHIGYIKIKGLSKHFLESENQKYATILS